MIVAISAYVGRPGSGKSYGVVENVILPALRAGRLVVTNIPLHMDVVLRDFDAGLICQLTNPQLEGGDDHFWLSFPGGAVIVLDEVWRIWPAGLSSNRVPKSQREFFSEHRHKVGHDGFTQEIALVVQSVSQIAVFIHELIDTTYFARKLDKVGMQNRYTIDVYDGVKKGRAVPVSSFTGTYKQAVYQYYQSHTKSQTGLPGMERHVDDRGSIFRNKVFLAAMPLAVVFVLFSVSGLTSFFRGDHLKKPPSPSPVAAAVSPARVPVTPAVTPVTPAVTPVVRPPPPPLPPESKIWRVAGFSSDGVVSYVHLQSVYRRHRRLPFAQFCRLQDSAIQCLVSGELVAPWTGNELPDLSAVASTNVAASVSDVGGQR